MLEICEIDKMSADIGTRKGAKIWDVVEGSSWISGLAWMSKPGSDFPTLTIDDIELSKSDLDESEKEIFTIKPNEKTYVFRSFFLQDENVDKEIKCRYQYSKYVIDPNGFRFR